MVGHDRLGVELRGDWDMASASLSPTVHVLHHRALAVDAWNVRHPQWTLTSKPQHHVVLSRCISI